MITDDNEDILTPFQFYINNKRIDLSPVYNVEQLIIGNIYKIRTLSPELTGIYKIRNLKPPPSFFDMRIGMVTAVDATTITYLDIINNQVYNDSLNIEIHELPTEVVSALKSYFTIR